MYDITLSNKHFFLPGLNNSTQCHVKAIFVFIYFFSVFFFLVGGTVTFVYHFMEIKI